MKEIRVKVADTLHSDISAMAKENNCCVTEIVVEALKVYRDYRYMGDRATIINEEILKMVQANINLLLKEINNKSNRVLSEVAIQSAIQNMIISSELDVSSTNLERYRKQAVDFLQSSNRVLRLDEILPNE